jgi:hypothetical protein
MSLITRSIGPNAQGEKLTFAQMDNNLYYLQSLGISGLTYSANTLSITNPTGGTISTNIGGVNRWLISSGETITIDSFYQSFVYGDVVVEGTLDIKENSQLVIINGDLINSGGTIIQSGDTYLIDLPLVDTSVDSFVYSNNTFTITDNFGETYSAVLNVVTGLTVNGVISATTMTALSINLCDSNGTLYTNSISGCSPINILSETYFYEGLSATTISGGTFYGDGSNLSGITGGNSYTYEIGEYVQSQGGVIFHRYKDGANENYLVVSMNDLTNFVGVPWSDVDVSNTANSSWYGLSNSNIIAFQSPNSAAQLCLNYTVGSNDDWYLPAIDELYLLMQNRFNVNKTLQSNGGTNLLYLNNFMGMPVGYWSSTQSSVVFSVPVPTPQGAMYVNFFTGQIAFQSKLNNLPVRAVRNFSI